MRVIAGKYAGKKLLTPSGASDVRPTTGMAKEALFNILSHAAFDGETAENALVGARVADICCGFGALGIEALSRGATFATFVDLSSDNLRLARDNVEKIGARNDADFVRADIAKLPDARAPYDVIFLDPPYGSGLQSHIADLPEKHWIVPGGAVVLECPKQEEWNDTLKGWELYADRLYGKTRLCIAVYRGA
ncbi:MAG: RsmD family RNA methyltransferase [Rickettsiales bacterium]